MIAKKVKEMLSEKDWTFADLQNINLVVQSMVGVLNDELSAEDKLELVWDSETNHAMSYNTLDNEPIPMPFSALFQGLVEQELTTNVIAIVKIELMNANVNFNYQKEVDTNEVSEGSVGRKSPKKGKTTSKKDSNE